MQIMTRPLAEHEIPEVERILRLAFGTFLAQPDPEKFLEGYNYVRSRWQSSADSAFVAHLEGQIVGSNFATNWGSFSFFGPLTVHPAFWNRKVGISLMHPVIDCFDRWGSRLQGLFTFPQSNKHVELYGKFGFWPRFLTKIVQRPVTSESSVEPGLLFSQLSEGLREEAIQASRRITDSIFDGLDLENEVRSVHRQGLGETVLIEDNRSISGLAICHCGAETEAGPGRCFVKFAAVRPDAAPETHLLRLLSAIEDLARARKLETITAGVNTGRERLARLMGELGFRTLNQGVAMHRPNDPGFSRRDSFVLDDWR